MLTVPTCTGRRCSGVAHHRRLSALFVYSTIGSASRAIRDCATAAPPISALRTVKKCGARVYDIRADDLLALDSFKDGYRREMVKVHTLDKESLALEVLIYVAELEPNVPLPNAEYKRLILEGAHYWKLPRLYITRLGEIIVAP